MQESAGGDHVAAHNKAGKPAKSPAAALREASQASLDDGTMQHTVCILAKRIRRGTGQSCQKFNTVNPGLHRRSGPWTHCKVENAAWTLRNRRRNKALTARQGGEIDLEGSAACDWLRFPDVYRYGRRIRDVETVSKNKTCLFPRVLLSYKTLTRTRK